MPDLHQLPVYSLVDEADASELQKLLKAQGWTVKHLSSAGARDKETFMVSTAESLRFDAPKNWSALADRLPEAIVAPSGPRVALVWWGAGDLASVSLGTLLSAFDLFVDMARQAYESDIDVAIFLLGSGASFCRLNEVVGGAADDLGPVPEQVPRKGASR